MMDYLTNLGCNRVVEGVFGQIKTIQIKEMGYQL